MKLRWVNIICLIGIFLQIGMGICAHYINRGGFIFDHVIFVCLTLIVIFRQKAMNVNWFVAILIQVAFFLHGAGTFGFYGNSPFFVPYDHVTHFVGFFVLSVVFMQLYWDDLPKLSVLGMILLACMGVGSFVEMMEYQGYLHMGEGDGVFFFGDGDLNEGQMLEAGGGWINTMIDLINNLLGTLTGMGIMLLRRMLS